MYQTYVLVIIIYFKYIFFKVYQFKYPKVPKPSSLRIYECHVGIATSEYKVGTYQEFKDKMLDRIVDLGKL